MPTPQEQTDLLAEVTAETTVYASVVTWINGATAQLAADVAVATDFASLKAAVAANIVTLKANAAAVAAAIPANTPAAP